MSVTSALCTSFKQEILQGVHISTDVYKILLLKVGATGTYDATVTNVGTPGTGSPTTANVGTDEASGTGYTTGGVTMSGFTTSSSGTTVWIDWTTDPSWAASSISAIGAIIYNSTRTNKAVAVISFGGTITDTSGTFTITLPTADATNAIIRLA
jgi:hypothetical protein